MWTRRRLLALILLLPLLAKGGEDEAEPRKKGEEGKKEEPFPPLYGPVEGVVEKGLWVAGKRVILEGDLWEYIAPGMVVAVAGKRLRVVEPTFRTPAPPR